MTLKFLELRHRLLHQFYKFHWLFKLISIINKIGSFPHTSSRKRFEFDELGEPTTNNIFQLSHVPHLVCFELHNIFAWSLNIWEFRTQCINHVSSIDKVVCVTNASLFGSVRLLHQLHLLPDKYPHLVILPHRTFNFRVTFMTNYSVPSRAYLVTSICTLVTKLHRRLLNLDAQLLVGLLTVCTKNNNRIIWYLVQLITAPLWRKSSTTNLLCTTLHK